MLLGAGVPAASAVQGDVPTGAAAAATARLEIGGKRACSGALVSPWWVVTAASCFQESPGAAVVRGAPKEATTATVGRTDLTVMAEKVVAVDHLVPHPDRDVVLARLSSAVDEVAPVKVATAAPTIGEQLTVAGYGRTATQMVPDAAHASTYTVMAVGARTLEIEAHARGATICKGDAGGPALRTTATRVELVAIHHTAYQGGCLGATNTPQGATESRLDDLGSWLTTTMLDVPLASLTAADWSGDAHADVLGVDVRGNLWYYPHDGNGLSPRTQLGHGWGSFKHVIATDFSGDGKADVLGVDDHGRLWYYPHNGDALSTPVLIGSGWQTFSHVTADDWNSDGKADVLGVDADGKLWLYVNTDLVLARRVQLGNGWGSFRQVMAADFSGDGHADVLGVDAGGRLLYYPHNGGALSAPTQIGSGWAKFKQVMASDWTGDGRADVLGVDGDGQAWVYGNVGLALPARVQIPGAPQMK
ncbi:FG-GAP-like repeat-containing protein [Cellulomonas sp.]|uniref:FG-GAP-like repeat-containing protein n=1 Tax=Cellulomonas sp. TaxID=40001 RepID=UPI0028112702|nr:FG-GAP-like repeat-containing protein [Cellulomonas sp.]